MTLVSNDPSYWPLINSHRLSSYFIVASFVAVVYDWALTFGQEFELVWNQPWSHTTLLYLSVRYAGIPYAAAVALSSLPTVSVTDTGCNVMNFTLNWMTVVITAMLLVIVINRLHAMYQRSRKMLIFLIVIFLPVIITLVVITGILNSHVSGEEFVLSGTYLCNYDYDGAAQLLISMTWILGIIWEILVLCLAVWIAVKHFRERRMGWTIVDCFTVLTKTPMVYFVISIAVSSLSLGDFSPKLFYSSSAGSEVYYGVFNIAFFVQMFVLGPRLILSVREYNAKLTVDFDALTTIVFQEHDQVSTGSGV